MRSDTSDARARARIAEAFADAGVTGLLHARDLDGGAELALGADTLVSTASVHKLCVLTTLFRQAAAGRIDLTRQLDIPVGGRTDGPTGLAAMLDAARLSLRDLAYLSVAVSDNTAADLIWDELGLDAVNSTMAELGLTRTVAVHKIRDLIMALRLDTGCGSPVDPAVVARLRVLDPAFTNRSTAREMTALLAAIWHDQACPGEHGAALRRLLALQVWPHRLASGFPFDDVRVNGKTGTLPTLRHEVGVIEYPDGGRYAVAVFTRAAATNITLPAADAVIGTAARLAVDALREGGGVR
ncbi:class A beta-lactamase-related serine hydrolase [Kitasatospora sp. RB6PN24]|uniref:serine hydrolase n=1 Tax=Kitasatospora humi TaxID=2893891 RepID=UPI001E546DE0|nr:serine hydrolase [Kitasatospora humi]MCC9307872.1 class A beta-lactamase-related serine hydrolase [Kitasatospora humi]